MGVSIPVNRLKFYGAVFHSALKCKVLCQELPRELFTYLPSYLSWPFTCK